MSRTPDYYRTKKNNYQNRLEIGNDSQKAKEIGISYGKYKAGMKPTDSQSDYAVHKREHLTKTEKEEPEQKISATIRIR